MGVLIRSCLIVLLFILWHIGMTANHKVKCHPWWWSEAEGSWMTKKVLTPCTEEVEGSLPTSCSLPQRRYVQIGFVGNGCGSCRDTANCRDTMEEMNRMSLHYMKCYAGFASTKSQFESLPVVQCSTVDGMCYRPLIVNGTPVNSTATSRFGCNPLAKLSKLCDEGSCKICTGSRCNKWPEDDDMTCKIGTASNESEYFNLPSKLCPFDPVLCMRPLIVDGAPVSSDFNTFGCVKPIASCNNTAECKTCSSASDCNTWPKSDDLKCKTGTASDLEEYLGLPSHFCPYRSEECLRPIIVNGAPVNSGFNTFGCVTEDFDCKNESECVKCSGSDCNLWPDAASDYLIKCYIWSWSKDAGRYKPSSVPEACSRKVGGYLPTFCSLPVDRRDQNGFSSTGCGPCADLKKCVLTIERMNDGQWQKVPSKVRRIDMH